MAKIYFGIGVAASGILGSVALLVMPTLAGGPGHDRWHWFDVGDQKPPLVLYDALPRPPQARQLPMIDVIIPRAERAGAPLRLEHAALRDAQAADDFVAVLRNLPASVSLSRGQREDQTTWRICKGDLKHLYLVMRKDAPDTFEIAVDLVAGKQMTPAAMARVRVVDEAPIAALPAAPSPGVAVQPANAAVAVIGAPVAAKKVQAVPVPVRPALVNAGAVAKPPAARSSEAVGTNRTGVAPVAPARGIPPDAVRPEIARPQGIRGLGGPGVVASSDALWSRQVWWSMPPPAWSPFKEAGIRQ